MPYNMNKNTNIHNTQHTKHTKEQNRKDYNNHE